MGNASGNSARHAPGCPLFRESDTLLSFCRGLQSELANGISRSGREDLSQLCSEAWCSLAVGHICVKWPSLFKYQMGRLGDLNSTVSPRLVDSVQGGCTLKKTSHFLRLASRRLG